MNAAMLGHAALWGAITAGALTLIPAPGGRLRRLTLAISATLSGLSVVILSVALISGDFSLSYVAETTSRATPWPYRLAALWGGMDGSMVFYAALTLLVGWIGLRRSDAGRLATGTVAFVGTGYLLIAALAADPFATLDIPAVDGGGLLAILQHPAMVYHPPILYLGLTTLVVPFALTLDALHRRQVGLGWLRSTRRWLFISWTLLTFGMLAGANWAYIELGWGGFWAWDPVENTALMPWLAATVFIHTSRIQERDARLRRWNVLFALLPFALTILGVYLTRSGVTGSIHSFAEDPVIGRTLLTGAVIALVIAGIGSLRAARGPGWGPLGVARDSWLLISGGLVAAALVFVTVGTAYPAYAHVFFDQAVNVDSRFFMTTVYPIALVVGVLTGFALKSRWSGFGPGSDDLGWWLASAVGVGMLAVGVFEMSLPAPITLVGAAAAGIVLLARQLMTERPRGRAVAGHAAHLGLVMILLGAAGSALGGEFRGVMAPGDSVEVSGRKLSLLDVETGEAERFIYVRGTFEMDGGHRLTPEIRAYEDQDQPVAEPVMRSTPLSDVIVAISRLSPDAQTVSVSVFVRPMVWWVWGGAVVMAIGGLAALYRIGGGVSTRRRVARGERLREGTTTDMSAR